MAQNNTSILDKLGVDIGFKTTYERKITEDDINLFAAVSGDHNPVHMREEYAKKTFFGGRIAHGALSLALLSACMSTFPGLVIFLSQSVKFLKPIKIGDTITASAETIGIRKDKGIVTLQNSCVNQNGETIVEGEAAIRLYEEPA